MSYPIHVLGFAGSLRRASFNAGLLRAAGELLPEGMTLEIFDLSPIPLFNADVEAAGLPEAVQQFKARVAAADALLIVTPEYNYSLPQLQSPYLLSRIWRLLLPCARPYVAV